MAGTTNAIDIARFYISPASVDEIKDNSLLRKIPVIIFTTSRTQSDIEKSYELGASCYVTKPKTIGEWKITLGNLGRFWIENVILA